MSDAPITPQTLAKIKEFVTSVYPGENDEMRTALLQSWGNATEERGLDCVRSFEKMAASYDKAKPYIEELLGKNHPALNA